MKILILFLLMSLVIGGCSTGSVLPSAPEDNLISTETETSIPVEKVIKDEQKLTESEFILPIAEYGERLRYKAFGEFIQDRFKGYHVGDDIEYDDEIREVPVIAIADGIIAYSGVVEGYGGLVIIKHNINGKILHSMYGHIDLSSTSLKVADNVSKGDFIGNLGADRSKDTDGERKHLHFALYEGDELRFQGYESSPEKVAYWINPYEFFRVNGVKINNSTRLFEPRKDAGGDIFDIQFMIPEGWDVEYIPSIKALNLFTLSGEGTARDRSQIFIRYFDAASFLTLPTVTIFETNDIKIGKGNYTARRYDIEKKPGSPDFADQPKWRNLRHVVTDFRGKEGFTRYFVVAANPALDVEFYESILASMSVQ